MTNPSSSPEIDVLLACSRARLGPGHIQYLDTLLRRDLDWNQLCRLADDHGVLPLLHRHLEREFPSCFAQEQTRDLRSRYEQNAARNLILVDEMRRVTQTLAAGGVSSIPLKGPLLASVLYGSFALRYCGDLDVLVKTADVPAACKALQSAGYRLGHELSAEQHSRHIQVGSEYPFFAVSGTLIELQWRIVPRQFSIDLPEEMFWSGIRSVRLGSTQYASLSPENLLLFLCVHGGKHLWNRIIWIADISELVSVMPPDWDLFLRLARQTGALRLCLLGLHVASRFLGTVLPDQVQRAISADPAVRRLGNEVAGNLLSPDYTEWQAHRFGILVRERAVDRLHYVWRTAFTPALGEWEAVRLPKRLFPLYHLVRIGRLATKPFARRREE